MFQIGYFPDKWSEGFIVPLFKKGDINEVSNYRGITLLSTLGKLFPRILNTLMEIKGFSQCIAANKQQACGLAAAASCGKVAACEFFVCKLVLLLLVAATLRLLVAATLLLLVAATLQLLVAATLQLIVCCNLAACAFFACKLDFSLLVAACLLQTVAACLLQTAETCLLQTAAASLLQTVAVI